MRIQSSLCAIAFAIALPGAASAMVSTTLEIPGLFTTGVDDLGNKLAIAGAIDPHWLDGITLASATAATTYTHPAYITSSTGNFIGGDNHDGGSYFLQFSLAGLDAATAQLSGLFAVDNGATIYLNDHAIGGYVVADYDYTSYAFQAFQALHSFTTADQPNYFKAGLNTLEFRVTDYGHPSGVMVTSLGGTASRSAPVTFAPELPGAVPEPVSWAMMVCGFGLLGASMRRRKVNVTFA